jgi:hypothetical protein
LGEHRFKPGVCAELKEYFTGMALGRLCAKRGETDHAEQEREEIFHHIVSKV